jgi:hypothetical protein
MNISYTPSWSGPQNTQVSALIESATDDASAWTQGHVECLQQEHRHLLKSFATLVDLLASKGMLTAPEVVQIAHHYNADPDATFTP